MSYMFIGQPQQFSRMEPTPIGPFQLHATGVKDPYPHFAGWEGTQPATNWICAEFSGNGIKNPYDPHYTFAAGNTYAPGGGIGLSCCPSVDTRTANSTLIDCPSGFCQNYY